ncbi:HAD hydrolase-like protein, partial [Phascolarctobacterium succinatutens]|uniref:HAD hydrolase-like protein n=1 Tax=Phascolarctobacterium succinatutens TaxID=626940 RepID=UPI00402801EE
RLYAAFSVFLLLQLSNFRACAKLGVKPEECLCVGDSPFDLQSGRSAGAKTVAVRYTAFGWEKLLEEGRPDFVIARPQELLEIVGKAK